MDIFLLWNNERAEHGESPTLEEVFATRELAQTHADTLWSPDDYDDEDDLMVMYAIECRHVLGSDAIETYAQMALRLLTEYVVTVGAFNVHPLILKAEDALKQARNVDSDITSA